MDAIKGNGRNSRKAAPAKTHTNNAADFKAKVFAGTDNPRHLRVLQALLQRPLCREELDSVAGASNGPDLVAKLHRLGLEVPCTRINFIDRDGKPCRPGVYKLTNLDRCKILRASKSKVKAKANKGDARTAAKNPKQGLLFSEGGNA